jgi:exodeoxyribonuclease VII large subunit
LGKEGLFDADRKRSLPAFPRRVGVITSPQAAALRDVLTTLQRRMPSLPVLLYPTQVQGRDAAAQIVAALNTAYQRAECDVLIVCRGGGSIEDLWSFNDESVARTIAASPIPLVSAIGHETDFTIADFVADLRAPTPTAAAELVSRDQHDLLIKAGNLQQRLKQLTQQQLNTHTQQLDYLARRLIHPAQRINDQRIKLLHWAQRLQRAQNALLERLNWQHAQHIRRLLRAPPPLAALQRHHIQQQHALSSAMHRQLNLARQIVQLRDSQLIHLNPLAVLARGYCIVQNANGDIIRSSQALHAHDDLNIRFAEGQAKVVVIQKTDS